MAGKRLAEPDLPEGGKGADKVARDRAPSAALAGADKVEEVARAGGNKAAKLADKEAAADKAARVVEAAVRFPAKIASKCANACSSFWEAGTSNP